MDFKFLNAKQREQLSEKQLNEYYKRMEEYYQKKLEKNEKQENSFVKLSKVVAPALKLLLKPTIINKELIPNEGGFIIASNHIDTFDQFPKTCIFEGQAFHGLMSTKLFRADRLWHGYVLERYCGIPVDTTDELSRRLSREVLANIVSNGGIALYYPEGRRKHGDDHFMISDFGFGAVWTAKETGRPIVPIGTNSEYKLFQSNNLMMRVGKPITVGKEDDLKEANTKLRDTIATLMWENMEDNRFINGPVDYESHKKRVLEAVEKEERKHKR